MRALILGNTILTRTITPVDFRPATRLSDINNLLSPNPTPVAVTSGESIVDVVPLERLGITAVVYINIRDLS